VKKLLVWAIAASLLVAAVVTSASALQTPTYEATARMLVGQEQQKSHGGIHPLPPPGDALTQTLMIYIDTRPVAREAIRRLDVRMSPDELLNNLTVEQVESSQFLRLTYTDTDPARAARVVNTVGQVSSERISASSASSSNIVATVFEKAGIPLAPVSPKPLRNGVLTLVAGLALCAGAALARTAGRARATGTLGERPSRQGVGQAGALGRWHRDYSIVKRVKEKELLRALGRRGKLTAVEAALETSLTVEETNRMLFELAAGGHLEVTVEHGKLLYSFWGEDGA
jgi:capsular polysaccharide biosynthesis protein